MATYVLRFLSVQRCNRVDTCAERPEKTDSLKNRHNVNTWVLKLYHLFAAKKLKYRLIWLANAYVVLPYFVRLNSNYPKQPLSEELT
jgi:hypothetical protein